MPNFANAKIYKLINSIDDKIYVGSTCKPLNKRFINHRTDAKTHPDRRIYNHFNNIGWLNVSIVLIESYQCNNKFELLQRERYYIDLLKPALNMVIPTRTDRQYYIDNADKIKQQHKQYKIDNAETCKQQQKQYKIDHNEAIKIQQKQYNIDNAEAIKEQQKQYRIKQKNIKYIKHMADLIASHQPKHYVLKQFDIFSILH